LGVRGTAVAAWLVVAPAIPTEIVRADVGVVALRVAGAAARNGSEDALAGYARILRTTLAVLAVAIGLAASGNWSVFAGVVEQADVQGTAATVVAHRSVQAATGNGCVDALVVVARVDRARIVIIAVGGNAATTGNLGVVAAVVRKADIQRAGVAIIALSGVDATVGNRRTIAVRKADGGS
jgi:hypothetical protein